jgi:hypothetical protein
VSHDRRLRRRRSYWAPADVGLGVSPRCIATISMGSSGLMAEHATTAGAATLWVFVPVDAIALERESRRGALDPAFGGAVLTSCGCVAWGTSSLGRTLNDRSRPFRRVASDRLHCSSRSRAWSTGMSETIQLGTRGGLGVRPANLQTRNLGSEVSSGPNRALRLASLRRPYQAAAGERISLRRPGSTTGAMGPIPDFST